MVGANRQTGGEPLGGRSVRTAPSHDVGLRRLAMCDGAGLVQRQPFQLAAFLEIGPALDEDAAPRGGGQTADNAHRRRGHEGTGAGDHQQHQGLVDPIQPGGTE